KKAALYPRCGFEGRMGGAVEKLLSSEGSLEEGLGFRSDVLVVNQSIDPGGYVIPNHSGYDCGHTRCVVIDGQSKHHGDTLRHFFLSCVVEENRIELLLYMIPVIDLHETL
ncbi:MAG: hypothetical protein V1695_03345, partial [Candidatus Uhrbacteria bacterium]